MAMRNCNCRLKTETYMPCSLASPSATLRWSTLLSLLLARPECLETSMSSGTNKRMMQKLGMTSRPSRRRKRKLKKNTTINAGQFGFSGNAEQVDLEVTNNQFEASIANFMDTHRSTQSVVSNLTDTNYRLTNSIPQLHQQMQMIQLMMQQQINNTAQNNLGNNGGNNNNYNNMGKKKKSGKGNSWNGGGNSNSGGNCWNGGGNSNSGGNSWNSVNSGGGGGNQRPFNVKLYNNNYYCWSHGHDLPRDHNSNNCNHQ